MVEVKGVKRMVRIYYSTYDENEVMENDWLYWGVFKNQEEEKHVWFKNVSKEEAEQYEQEQLLN